MIDAVAALLGVACGTFFLATAVGALRNKRIVVHIRMSGARNEPATMSKSPRRFWALVAFHSAIAIGCFAFAIQRLWVLFSS
jgi:hypothetical protein